MLRLCQLYLWANIPGMPGEASADSLVPEDIINQVLNCLCAATY